VQVHATDRVGLVGTATRDFEVDDTAPRATFLGHPSRTMHLRGKKASLKVVDLRAGEPVVFSCSLDRAAWYRCGGSTARRVTAATVSVRVRRGTHGLRIRAVDASGNQGPVAQARWFVKP
ncbi:hypothetical protein ACH5WX_09465, partial [Nocardioides sp. CER28]